MPLNLTDIPSQLGVAGAHLATGGMSGSPDLRELLVERDAALESIDAAQEQVALITVAFDDSALVAETNNGVAVAFSIGVALPAGARVTGFDVYGLTPFAGGGLTSMSADIGTSADPNALIAAADLFAAAVDGGPAAMPLGVRPFKYFGAGAQLLLTLTPDASHAMSGLTAGAVTAEVRYAVLP